MGLTDQIDLLHTWLAEHPRPAGVAVSAYLQSCASAGDQEARRILASGLFNDTDNYDAEPEAPAPLQPHVQEREHRLATQQLPTVRNTAEPRRPIVQSGERRPWLLSR